jgi:hypothetical protein
MFTRRWRRINMKKYIIRKTWVVKAEKYDEALMLTQKSSADTVNVKVLEEMKGGKEKENGKKIKIEKIKKKNKFKKW